SFFSDGGGPGIQAWATGGLAASLEGRVNTYDDITVLDGVDTAAKIDLSAKQISTFGSDGLEQIRLWGSSYGEILLHDNTGNDITAILSATSNGGGALQLMDELGTIQLSLAGGNAGDASANFPVDAINASETLEEAGIANRIQDAGSIIVDLTATDVLIRTISAPTNGYVIAMASAYLEGFHSNATATDVEFYVAPTGGGAADGPRTEMLISSNWPSGSYRTPVAVSGVFSVPSGNTQFRLLATRVSGSSAFVLDAQLTLMFVPTAYGTVTGNLQPTPPIGSESPELELAKAEEFNMQRIQAEVTALRTQLDALTAKLASQENQ
ncbi:MAG TPA: hypothetical protein VLB27_04445, partial [candidate division Zixibacteria bacterium]|nr:hypothetical protein [candidate division Zixibacteria bacterium]